MEYADNGTLRNYLKENFKNLTWHDKFRFALQLARAVSCLHDKEIVHSDLVNSFTAYYNCIMDLFTLIKLFCLLYSIIAL
jgi:serine/threonine protein kinase